MIAAAFSIFLTAAVSIVDAHTFAEFDPQGLPELSESCTTESIGGSDGRQVGGTSLLNLKALVHFKTLMREANTTEANAVGGGEVLHETAPKQEVKYLFGNTGDPGNKVKGWPICVLALLFGLASALSLTIGALLGVKMAPISKEATARWLAFGAGALVYAVATQLYGNHLFALLAVSRRYGPFDKGCVKDHGVSVCDEMLWNLVVQMLAGLLGAGFYIVLARSLESFSPAEVEPPLPSSTFETTVRAERGQPAKGSRCETLTDLPTGIGTNIALCMWLGMLLDSIPEAIMLGLMTNRHRISFGLLFGIFLANFPAAFSGSSILQEQGVSDVTIVLLWSSIFVSTGLIAMTASAVMPESYPSELFSRGILHVTACAEGLAGGAMLAMMSTAMLPAAYRGVKNEAGIYFVFGFVISVLIEALHAYFEGPHLLPPSRGNVKVILPSD